MIRVIVAVILTAAVQFAWGFAFYGPLSSLNYMTNRPTSEMAAIAAVEGVLPETGTYFVPMCPGAKASAEEMAAFEKRFANGPVVQIHYRKAGPPMPTMAVLMGTGFTHTALTGLLAALLLCAALPGLPGYLHRVGFVFGLGLFAVASIRLSDMIWFHHHWAFVVGEIVYCTGAWLLGGLVMAAIIRPGTSQVLARAQSRPSIAA